jgi:hypothetical protein
VSRHLVLLTEAHTERPWATQRYLRRKVAQPLGDEVADRLLAALQKAGDAGVDRQAQRDVFGRNLPAARLALAREYLEERGLVVSTTEETGGRPRTITRAVTQKDAVTQKGSGV